MADAALDRTSPAHRPPQFGPADRAVPTSAATSLASALAASEHHFAANATQGEWPMPYMSAEACDVLGRMLTHAAATSPQLGRLNHDMPLLPHEVERFDRAMTEILQANFGMPVEGGTFPVAVIDQAVVRNARVLFSVNSMYAAHVKCVGALGAAMVDLEVDIAPVSLAVEGETFALDEGELSLLIGGLQAVLNLNTMGYNFNAIERLRAGRDPDAPSAFGIPQTIALLRKLGALPGGGGLRELVKPEAV